MAKFYVWGNCLYNKQGRQLVTFEAQHAPLLPPCSYCFQHLASDSYVIALLTKHVVVLVVVRLNLRENELEDRGAAIIARVLPSLPALQVLDLCANQIMRPGAVAVAKALVSQGRKEFQLLALDENAISDAGVEQITDLLKVSYSRTAHAEC